MSNGINVGAFVIDPETGKERRPKSKAEVARMLAADPSKVRFDVTVGEVFREANGFPAQFRGDKLLDELGGRRLDLCGPDPRESRVFYGTVRIAVTPKKGRHVKVE